MLPLDFSAELSVIVEFTAVAVSAGASVLLPPAASDLFTVAATATDFTLLTLTDDAGCWFARRTQTILDDGSSRRHPLAGSLDHRLTSRADCISPRFSFAFTSLYYAGYSVLGDSSRALSNRRLVSMCR